MDRSKYRGLIIAAAIGVILGVLLGMLLFWVVFPVKWTNAHSYDLAPDAKVQYMALVADSFKVDGDPARANGFLAGWEPEERQQVIQAAIQQSEAEGRPDQVQTLNDLSLALGLGQPTEPVAPPTPPEPPSGGIWKRIQIPCLVFVVVLLAMVLGVLGVRAWLQRRPGQKSQLPEGQAMPVVTYGEEPMVEAGADLGRFSTTYQLGEDAYEDSFSIKTPEGEFLGECGMGVAETIGMGEPDRVTAFDVWLFDKSDIRTVTKVLMTDHAYYDDTLRAKLATKGEAVLVEPGTSFFLEANALRLQVNVIDMVYGEEELPPKSYIDKLMVELVAKPRAVEPDPSDV